MNVLVLVFLLAPDIGMYGYLFGNKARAICYNIFHHKGLAILIYFFSIYLSLPLVLLMGIILLSHVAFDRAMSNGLKHTHLVQIENK